MLEDEVQKLKTRTKKSPAKAEQLSDKQEQLDKLIKSGSNHANTNNNPWLMPTLLIGGTIIAISLIILLSSKNKKKKYH